MKHELSASDEIPDIEHVASEMGGTPLHYISKAMDELQAPLHIIFANQKRAKNILAA
jgi:hypothetical protein